MRVDRKRYRQGPTSSVVVVALTSSSSGLVAVDEVVGEVAFAVAVGVDAFAVDAFAVTVAVDAFAVDAFVDAVVVDAFAVAVAAVAAFASSSFPKMGSGLIRYDLPSVDEPV